MVRKGNRSDIEAKKIFFFVRDFNDERMKGEKKKDEMEERVKEREAAARRWEVGHTARRASL